MTPDGARPPGIVCVGGAVLDRHLHLLAPAVPGTSNPARASSSSGGVARNVAENLALLGVPVRLVSRVGDDDAGRDLLAALTARGVDVGGVEVVAGQQTAQYVAVLDPDGELVLGAAAMQVLEGVDVAALDAAWPGPGRWLLADCNQPARVLAAARRRARADGTCLAVDAVSTPKVTRLARGSGDEGPDGEGLTGIALFFGNLSEARALLRALGRRADGDVPQAAGALVRAGAGAVVMTLGAQGVVIADATGIRAVPAPPTHVVDVTGAGDALVAATLARLTVGAPLDEAVRVGLAAAALTVADARSVRPDLAARLASSTPPA